MEKMENIENFNWELLSKYLNNEASSLEKSEVETWLNLNRENHEMLEQVRSMLGKVDSYYQMKNFDSGTAWQNVHSKINPEPERMIQHKNVRKEAILTFYQYAAIIIIALLLGSIGYYIGFRKEKPAESIQIVSAENQAINEFVLPDGTKVTLNSNSTLQFPTQFTTDVREVTITGEAFFDVTPNAAKPFVIHAGNAQVKVLGTSFNICAYPEDETVEVVVQTGKVQVSCKKAGLPAESHEVFLVPGEKGTFYNTGNLLEKAVNTNPNFLAWKTRIMEFNQVPLSEVVLCLEKVYHIDIVLAEPRLNELLLTAQFDKKPVDFILNVVRLTFNLELSVENEQFTLSGRTIEPVKR